MKTKLVIFGITGDLSRGKLLPALKSIVLKGDVDNLSIIGVSRRHVDAWELIEGATGGVELLGRTDIFTMDLVDQRGYVRLKEHLNLQKDDQALIYLAVPPSAAADIVDFLGEAGLNDANVKLLFEKPFGFDLASAQDFIERTAKHYKEEQLYRIDHYMAKEVASRVIELRSNAENHHHHWNNESVESVEVIATEALSAKDRGTFYEQTGALRDFIQGHLMQLLSLVLMDVSGNFSPSNLPEYRLRALQQIDIADPKKATRAQYEGYGEDVGNVNTQTETFAHIELASSDARWQGVKLTLTTGKSLDAKRSAIVIHYNDGSEDVFEEGVTSGAYEKVLTEAINGRTPIFTTSDEVLRSWEILAPVQEVWAMDNAPMKTYVAGTAPAKILS